MITLLGPSLVERFEAGRGAMYNGFDNFGFFDFDFDFDFDFFLSMSGGNDVIFHDHFCSIPRRSFGSMSSPTFQLYATALAPCGMLSLVPIPCLLDADLTRTLIGAWAQCYDRIWGFRYVDPGAVAFDRVDGEMFYYELNCTTLRTRDECNAFVGIAGRAECDWRGNVTNDITTDDDGANQYCSAKPCDLSNITVTGRLEGIPGSICRVTLGADGNFTFNRRLVGNQTLVYFAIDTSRNYGTTSRIINVVDSVQRLRHPFFLFYFLLRCTPLASANAATRVAVRELCRAARYSVLIGARLAKIMCQLFGASGAARDPGIAGQPQPRTGGGRCGQIQRLPAGGVRRGRAEHHVRQIWQTFQCFDSVPSGFPLLLLCAP